MDLLVLADSTGAVDMTPDAIARRTNVPIEEVLKYINQLCQPDPFSRSQLEEGKRLVALDSGRDWGWQIVNYQHYRKLKDEEARRSYFRDAQRKYRARKKGEKSVFDRGLTSQDNTRQSLTPSSSSSCTSVLKEGVRGRFDEWMAFRRGLGSKPKDWSAMFDKQANWLNQFNEQDQIAIIDQSIRNGWRGLFELRRVAQNGQNGMSPQHRQNRINFLNEKKTKLNRQIKDPQNPPSWAVKELRQIDSELQEL